MRVRPLALALGTTLLVAAALAVPGAPAGAAAPATKGGATGCFGLYPSYCEPTVRGEPSAWVRVGTERAVFASVSRVPGRMPASALRGAPVQLRVRAPGADRWTVSDQNALRRSASPNLYRAQLTFSFPRAGRVETQVRTLIHGRWFAAPTARHVVTTGSGRHHPVGLDPSVGSSDLTMDADLSSAAWWSYAEFASTSWTDSAYDIRGRLPFVPGFDPEWADDTESLVFSRYVIPEEDPVGTRVVLVDSTTRATRPVAFKADGERARFSAQPSTSDDARWVAYSSSSDAIVTPSPEGRKVFLADTTAAGHPTSILLGLGSHPSVSGNGRHVAYLVPDGRVVVWDRSTGSSTLATAEPVPGVESLAVVDDGSLVWSQSDDDGGREVVVQPPHDDGGDREVVGAGTLPVMTDDGRYVAYAGGQRYGDEVYGGVRRFEVPTGRTEVVAHGPGGTPSTTRIGGIEISGTGRYVVAAPDGGFPLLPNSSSYRPVRFDLG